jgi:hypothetical protein
MEILLRGCVSSLSLRESVSLQSQLGLTFPLWARILLLVGFAIALVGGMTSRAKILHIKPFGNSYKRARRSYEVKGDEQDKS